MSETKKQINITPSSSGNGLKEELESIARTKGLRVSTLVSKIYNYASQHQNEFNERLSNAREKPGQHITAYVSEDVKKSITLWAKKRETPRGLHCCYLIEYVLEREEMLKKVF